MANEETGEMPIDKYVKFKNNIQLWYNEMTRAGLTPEEQKILEPYFKQSYGVPPSQEQLMKMLMDEKICGFTLAEANAARKIVGKKQMDKIPKLHNDVLNKASSSNLGKYVWENGIGPQMGYSFSIIHALAYSFVGMQTLYLATNFNSIYWNTACLIVMSGALDDEEGSSDTTNYTKIAKAIGAIRNENIKVSLVDINKSMFGFIPDVKNNEILFGLKGMVNVGDDLVQTIIEKRPYISIKDFYYKVQPGKRAMVSLIKGGAFDSMMSRREAMAWFLWETCDKKSRLTLQNMPGLIKYNLLPEDTEERVMARRVYEFNRYLKAICKLSKTDSVYYLDERAINFLTELQLDGLIETEPSAFMLNIKKWDKYYQKWMDIFRNWISDSKDSILQTLNEKIFKEEWDKYAKGTISAWEMEALCFYYGPHELEHINYGKYGITPYHQIPSEPVIDRTFEKNGRTINLYKLYKICGTCIAKDKTKSSVSLLTTSGVVNVKFRKEYFSLFDKQISQKDEKGDKHVVEKSWFNRGSMIMVQGIKTEDGFMAKKYNSSQGHQLYKIDSIDAKGDIVLRNTRAQGDLEDEG